MARRVRPQMGRAFGKLGVRHESAATTVGDTLRSDRSDCPEDRAERLAALVEVFGGSALQQSPVIQTTTSCFCDLLGELSTVDRARRNADVQCLAHFLPHADPRQQESAPFDTPRR